MSPTVKKSNISKKDVGMVILEHISLCNDERRQANRDQESRGTHIVRDVITAKIKRQN